MEDVAVIILAAGKGTRMKSDLAKVLHRVAGKSMVVHVTNCARSLTKDHIHVVVGHQAEQVKNEVLTYYPVQFALQKELLGTGDAVKSALPGISSGVRHVLVLCGDVPLIREKTLRDLLETHKKNGAKLSLLAVTRENPQGYGRIISDAKGALAAIREESDATESEKKINLVNAGIYCFDRQFLDQGIRLIKNKNEQGEYYLTDLVEIAVSHHEKTHVLAIGDSGQVMGVNTPSELARAEALFHAGTNELP